MNNNKKMLKTSFIPQHVHHHVRFHSLRSVGVFNSKYPIASDAVEPDEFDEMFEQEIGEQQQPKTPAEAMEQRWLHYRTKEMQKKIQDDEMKAAVAKWREFRTRVEENAVRRQELKANIEPGGPQVYKKVRPMSAPPTRYLKC